MSNVWVVGVDEELLERVKYALEKWENVSKKMNGKEIRYSSYASTKVPWGSETPLVTVLCFDPTSEVSYTAAVKAFIPTIVANSPNPIFLTAVFKLGESTSTDSSIMRKAQTHTRDSVAELFLCNPDSLADVANLHVSLLGACLTVTGHNYCIYGEINAKERKGPTRKKVQGKVKTIFPKEGGITSSSCYQFGSSPLSNSSDHEGLASIKFRAHHSKSSGSLQLMQEQPCMETDDIQYDDRFTRIGERNSLNSPPSRSQSLTECPELNEMFNPAGVTLNNIPANMNNNLLTCVQNSMHEVGNSFEIETRLPDVVHQSKRPTQTKCSNNSEGSGSSMVSQSGSKGGIYGSGTIQSEAHSEVSVNKQPEQLQQIQHRHSHRRSPLGIASNIVSRRSAKYREAKRSHRRSKSDNVHGPCTSETCSAPICRDKTYNQTYINTQMNDCSNDTECIVDMGKMTDSHTQHEYHTKNPKNPIKRAVSRFRSFPSHPKAYRKPSLKATSLRQAITYEGTPPPRHDSPVNVNPPVSMTASPVLKPTDLSIESISHISDKITVGGE
eukprot:CFRG0726T1